MNRKQLYRESVRLTRKSVKAAKARQRLIDSLDKAKQDPQSKLPSWATANYGSPTS